MKKIGQFLCVTNVFAEKLKRVSFYVTNKVAKYEKLLVQTTRHIKCGKDVRRKLQVGVDFAALSCFCVSLLSKVITDALNFVLLTNILSAVQSTRSI